MTVQEMTHAEIDAALRETGSGVLSLAEGAETYAVPGSFGYDGRHLYFQFVHEASSHKVAFAEATDIATLTIFSEQPAVSVVVQGTIDRVLDTDQVDAVDALAANARMPHFNVSPDSPAEDMEFDFYRLTPTDRSGRRFGASETAETF